MNLASKKRREYLQSARKKHYDLVIIGGGITGAGIALDAVTRGMTVALIDKGDFGSGASSRSTKMIHGGLRYLQKLQLKTVSKAGKERAMLLENAPHLIRREKMLLPFYKGGTLGKFTTSMGLKVYDYLIHAQDDERRVMLNSKALLTKVPALEKSGLRGAAEYVEYRTDDARLTLEVIKQASEKGADCFNYLEAASFNYDEKGYIEAVVTKDIITGNTCVIEGSSIFNAAGAWIYDLMPGELNAGQSVNLIKGAHIVFDQSVFPLAETLYFDTGNDKKMIFAVPHQGKTYVGVSSALYKGKREMPTVSTTDIYYLLTAINHLLPRLKLTTDHIESSWAGIASVFVDAEAEKGQKPLITTADNGLMTVMSGRLSGYRALAESVVDAVSHQLTVEKGLSFEPCQTQNMPLSGGDVGGSEAYIQFVEEAVKRGVTFNLTKEEARELATIYGANVDLLFDIAAKASPDEMQGLPILLYVRLMYGLLYESVMTPSDFLIRRTGMLYFNIAQMQQYQVAIVKFMAKYFGWTLAEITAYNAEIEQALFLATHPVEDDGVVKLTEKVGKTAVPAEIKKD